MNAIDPRKLVRSIVRIFTHPHENPLLGGVPDRAGWVNLRYPTPSNLLKSIHSGLEGFSCGGYPPRPEGIHPDLEGIFTHRLFVGCEIDRTNRIDKNIKS
jgi:hypothetical protein